ncbi:MAG TPA: hypothetical protein VFG20_16825 [Planctomycetaceae bacterium]|nr:hypothetical protein [Planctomycetaceae bacterium]
MSVAGSPMSPQIANSGKRRNPWRGYALSLLFTAAGLSLLFLAGAQGVLGACEFPGWQPDPTALVVEAVAGGLTSVFGFLMLVQASPSVDEETTSAWILPDQRTFDDDAATYTPDTAGPAG